MVAIRTRTYPVPLLLSPQKAADFLGIGRTHLLALLKAKKLKAKVENGRRYFITASLLAHVASMEDAA